MKSLKKYPFSRNIVGILASAILIIMLASNNLVLAKEAILPQWEKTSTANVNISNRGHIISVSASIKAKCSKANINGDLLLCENDGGGWVIIDSWNINDVGNVTIGKKHNGIQGCSYKAKLQINVDGEQINKTSNIINT